MVNPLGLMALPMNSLKRGGLSSNMAFYNLCKAFQHNNLCLQSINSSFITLIPKVESPLHAFDFRPISLLNISLKLVTKLLANRLQRVIKQIIHKESIWLY